MAPTLSSTAIIAGRLRRRPTVTVARILAPTSGRWLRAIPVVASLAAFASPRFSDQSMFDSPGAAGSVWLLTALLTLVPIWALWPMLRVPVADGPCDQRCARVTLAASARGRAQIGRFDPDTRRAALPALRALRSATVAAASCALTGSGTAELVEAFANAVAAVADTAELVGTGDADLAQLLEAAQHLEVLSRSL